MKERFLNRKQAGLVSCVFVTLGIGVFLQKSSALQLDVPGRTPPNIGDLLPATSAGWRVEDLPLGQTEAIAEKAAALLRFQSYAFRFYQKASQSFAVYVAYWPPGAADARDIQGHTPDQCWVATGWACEAAEHRVAMGGNQGLAGGERRLFTQPSGQSLHVGFWHYYAGKPVSSYATRYSGMGPAWRWGSESVFRRFAKPGEQFYIRISSTIPLAELEGEPLFSEILARLVARVREN